MPKKRTERGVPRRRRAMAWAMRRWRRSPVEAVQPEEAAGAEQREEVEEPLETGGEEEREAAPPTEAPAPEEAVPEPPPAPERDKDEDLQDLVDDLLKSLEE